MVKDFSIKIECPMCGAKLNVTNERRVSFNCYVCGQPLVFTNNVYLPKGEPIEIDGRNVV